MLNATLSKRLGAMQLEIALQVSAAATLVLVGESGSGKTTILRLLAGLVKPDGGRIVVNDELWYDSDLGLMVSGWQRPIAYVAQDYALFPHLSVFENVAFGLRAQSRSPVEIREKVGQQLDRFGLSALKVRKPHQLSGGQQQRAALARALVLDPAVLLLDEPLSALDLKTRRGVRSELRATLRSLTCATVYVTHSPMEALVFGDQITVLADGRAGQTGTRQDLLRYPRSAFVAEFMGVNLFQGRIVSRDPTGLARLRTDAGELTVMDLESESDNEVFVAVSPREITIYRQPPGGSAQNVFFGPVTEMVPEPPNGERVRVALGTEPPLVAEVTQRAVSALGLEEGALVYAAFKATGVVPYH
ncbi:MAG: ABC transporter ATP-binding protein [Gemmatimonadota bacterium]